MGFVKHGTGKVLQEDEEQRKVATKDWTDADQADLDQENEQADGSGQ